MRTKATVTVAAGARTLQRKFATGRAAVTRTRGTFYVGRHARSSTHRHLFKVLLGPEPSRRRALLRLE